MSSLPKAPDLHEAVQHASDDELAHLILDGKIFSADRCSEKTTSVQGKTIDLWYSGKAGEHGGLIQMLSAPDGFPLWVSDVGPGSTHDITAARDHARVVGAGNGPVNKLTAAERHRILEVLNSSRFVDLAPLQIYAQLLDEGTYLCSVSTMYRVLRENKQVRERRRLARHRAKVCPELVASAPRQVYSWPFTKLAGPVKGQYFDAYVMIDIYFRYIVGVHVHTHESGVLATELMKEIFGVHGIPQVVHITFGSSRRASLSRHRKNFRFWSVRTA